jgi:hypothetical protein
LAGHILPNFPLTTPFSKEEFLSLGEGRRNES